MIRRLFTVQVATAPCTAPQFFVECGVINAESKQAIESLCPEVGKEVIQDFFARMDEDYFATFSPEEISTHIKMSCALARERPAKCRVTPRGPDEFDIVIVGYDYLSEFSIFCGLLSAFGLDIRAGNIYSFARRQAAIRESAIRESAIRESAIRESAIRESAIRESGGLRRRMSRR